MTDGFKHTPSSHSYPFQWSLSQTQEFGLAVSTLDWVQSSVVILGQKKGSGLSQLHASQSAPSAREHTVPPKARCVGPQRVLCVHLRIFERCLQCVSHVSRKKIVFCSGT